MPRVLNDGKAFGFYPTASYSARTGGKLHVNGRCQAVASKGRWGIFVIAASPLRPARTAMARQL